MVIFLKAVRLVFLLLDNLGLTRIFKFQSIFYLKESFWHKEKSIDKLMCHGPSIDVIVELLNMAL